MAHFLIQYMEYVAVSLNRFSQHRMNERNNENLCARSAFAILVHSHRVHTHTHTVARFGVTFGLNVVRGSDSV